ncbi:MAG: DUF1684 domain-containing protein [Planctomycetota bacterium]|jgi:uncharacterized protein (DUF1684 family)
MRRLVGLLVCLTVQGCVAADRGYVAEIDAWHARRVAALQSDTGALSQVGLYPLVPGSQSLGSAPDRDIVLVAAAPRRLGTITVADADITFTAEADVTVFGREPPERVETLKMATDRSGDPTVLSAGSLLLHVIVRGGEPFLRVRDRLSPSPGAFVAPERFPVDERWRVTATLIAANDDTLAMPNVLGQMTTSPSPGVLEFELEGSSLQLVPTVSPDGRLFIVFADVTTGTETYSGGRFLTAGPVSDDGRVILDFNRSYAPICAFNAFSTCPLPPRGNALPIAVRAGEKYAN